MMPTLKISSLQDGKRLDVVLARLYRDYSRSFLQKWIKDGRVTRQGLELVPNYRVRAGEDIEVAEFSKVTSPLVGEVERSSGGGQVQSNVPPSQPRQTSGESPAGLATSPTRGEGVKAPKIIFEDANLLVLNKPAGLVVHPAPSHKGFTLVDWLEDYLGPTVTGKFADGSRLGVVHRLDKDTTGVLLVAKTVTAQNALGKQFQDRLVQKTYAAFIEGIPPAQKGIISAPVGRSHRVPSRMAVSSSGRPSETSFEIVESYREVSHVSLHPKTGRTHQIRVHCAAIGHPILGDRTYGSQTKWSKDYGIDRPLLHAECLVILHPATHKKVQFEAPWPEDMKAARRRFRASMKALVLAISLLTTAFLRAEDGGSPAHAKTTHTSSGGGTSGAGAAGSIKTLKREVSSLRDQFKSLIEEVSALQDRVTGIQSSLDELGAARRLHDLEKAISDLNSKASNTSSVSEDTKSAVLDLSRKIKTQQEILDQVRNQVDRLQREMIQKNAHEQLAPPEPAPAVRSERNP